MQKGVVVNLLDEEIRHVGARDESACPVARIDQRAIGTRLMAIGQYYGTHDHPLEVAPADDALLHVLVIIDASQQQMERRAVKKPAAATAVASGLSPRLNAPERSTLPLTVICDAAMSEFCRAEQIDGLTVAPRASVAYAASLTASISVESLLSAFELLIRLETAHRCK